MIFSDIKPKPCPFCGEKDRLDTKGGRNWIVECRMCGCTLYTFAETEDGAIKIWNKRYKECKCK